MGGRDRGRDAGGRTRFDPEVVGRQEARAWAAYYRRRWLLLFRLMLRLMRDQFGLSPPRALCAAGLATWAQVVFARRGAAGGHAERAMRRFYALVREPTGRRYDPARAAALEVRWWVVHRERARAADRSALARALAESYAVVHAAPVERMLPAAVARARAMDLSDRWVAEGRDPASPLLPQIAAELVASYRALAEAGG
jgi:hypothetical protein